VARGPKEFWGFVIIGSKLDGWMDGWMDRWMDGWAEGRAKGRVVSVLVVDWMAKI
jgi:hypothetical protein